MYQPTEEDLEDLLRFNRYHTDRVFKKLCLRVPREDLESEGYLGIMKAMRKFDPSKGAPFRPYAAMCIKWAISAYVQKTYFAITDRKSEEPYSKLPQANLVQLSPVTENRLKFTPKYDRSLYLRGLISTYPEGKKEIFDLYLEGFTLGEIAKKVKQPQRKVYEILMSLVRKHQSEHIHLIGLSGRKRKES